jgi:GNAT superfamily N-acetyltransferase
LNAFECRAGGEVVGYGCVGGAPGEARDVVKEFFVLPASRGHAPAMFRALVAASSARWIEAQTNDPLLSEMLDQFAVDATGDVILFADATITTYAPPAGCELRAVTDADRARMFAHTSEPVGEWGIEFDGRIVATPPYGDIFMEVAAPYRRRGIGSYLVQELKRIAYAGRHIPGARCRANNVASQRTLERAGMIACGSIVRARIA